MHKIRAHPRTKLSLQSRPHLGRSELQPLRFHNNNDDDDGFSLASSFLSLSSSSSSSSSSFFFVENLDPFFLLFMKTYT